MSSKNIHAKNPKKKVAATAIVPWNSRLALSDAMRLPVLTNQVFGNILTYETGLVSSSVSVISAGTVVPVLTNFSGYADLIGAFDQYRILMIEIVLRPQSNTNTAATSNYGELATVLDYDDGTALSTFSAAIQYQNCIVTPGYEQVRRCFKPRVALAAYSGTFTSYANSPGETWIDSSSTGVKFYGMKYVWTTTSVVCTYDMVVRAHIQWKNTR